MPAYTYRCRGCHAERDTVHAMTEEPRVECECGLPMRRRPTWNGGARLVGRGWAKHPDRDATLGILPGGQSEAVREAQLREQLKHL
jgi:putative FmdB family regulatory protein